MRIADEGLYLLAWRAEISTGVERGPLWFSTRWRVDIQVFGHENASMFKINTEPVA